MKKLYHRIKKVYGVFPKYDLHTFQFEGSETTIFFRVVSDSPRVNGIFTFLDFLQKNGDLLVIEEITKKKFKPLPDHLCDGCGEERKYHHAGTLCSDNNGGFTLKEEDMI